MKGVRALVLGIYLSRCGGRVGHALDLDALAADFAERAAVVRVFDSFFDPEAQRRMVDDVAEHGLDAAVLGGDSVRHYEHGLSGRYLWESLQQAGINRNRMVPANLLQQVAMAHAGDARGAAAKARAVLAAAVVEAGERGEAEGVVVEPRKRVLVLGPTTEGLIATQRLIDLGYDVVLAGRGDVREQLSETAGLVGTQTMMTAHPSVEVVDGARVTDGHGWLGDYEIELTTPQGPRAIQVGGMLLADTEETAWVDELRQHFKIDVDDEGRARSLDPALHPAETLIRGIMVVPHYGGGRERLREKVAAADSAVVALELRLNRETVPHHFYTSKVDESLCGGCASCVRTCAFGACSLGADGLSHVDERRCRGCGKCVVSCPVGARDLVSSPHRYLMEAVRQLHAHGPEGAKVLGFLCGGCGYPAADEAGHAVSAGLVAPYPASFLPLRVPCGGRIDTLHVLEGFRAGFDAVVVFRCREGHCHNLVGNVDMDRRINLLRTFLRARGLDPERLRIIDISPDEGEQFAREVNGVYTDLRLTEGAGR